MQEIQLSQGTIRYVEEGSGPPVVLVHGALVNAAVWERVVPLLAGGARVIAPDLPLGSHRIAMNPNADLSPPGLAELIAELLERLELDDVTLVGNDTGGALSQVLVTRRPERVGRLVLTNCDAFEHFPPPSMAFAVKAMRVPAVVAAFEMGGRLRAMRTQAMKIMALTVEPIPDRLVKQWVDPLRDRDVRRDFVKVMRGFSNEYTLEAGRRLGEFGKPALIAWGMRDKLFSSADAERLAAALPNARLEKLENARTFVQLDVPERLAELIRGFVSAPAVPGP
jgi:pimeloyl-ACP methyl ester carboxylesterase